MQSLLFLFLLCSLRQTYAYNTVCYDEMGCFVDGPPFGDTPERPGTHLPQDPSKINTKFLLDTRTVTSRQVFRDNMDDLSQTSFDPSKPIKFLVHGFIHNGEIEFLTDMSAALLEYGDFNVIRVNWKGGSFTINYPQAVADTQIVGSEIKLFMENLVNTFGVDTKQFHCIGHSLGAHTCGYTGKYITPNIARISGLDPAGPYFENTPEEVRLDSSDADFVDVLHSDAEKLLNLGMGTAQVSGHIDFWPNNGIDQPGCDQNALSTIVDVEGINIGIQNFVACNHLRSLPLYTESINSKCSFSAVPCSSYEDYLNGKCLDCPSGVCPRMGYHSIDAAGTISSPNHYLKTDRTAPYCEDTVYAQVILGSKGDTIDGTLHLSLYSIRDNTEQELLGNEGQELALRPATTYSYLTQFRYIPEGLNRVKLLWTKEEFTITNQYITVAQINVWSETQQKMFSFCGDGSTQLKQEERYSFSSC